jgi:hypothetical protein
LLGCLVPGGIITEGHTPPVPIRGAGDSIVGIVGHRGGPVPLRGQVSWSREQ